MGVTTVITSLSSSKIPPKLNVSNYPHRLDPTFRVIPFRLFRVPSFWLGQDLLYRNVDGQKQG